jgi:endonuclease-3
METKDFTKALKIVEKEYPKWQTPIIDLIAIQENNPFKILISTILSLRTQDKTTAAASKRLYAVADTPEKIAELPISSITKLIYPVGFYKTKAPQIKTICQTLVKAYNSKVPNTMEELLKFKGVGRKTANLVLAVGYDIPAICVDTHVHRITNRLGYVKTKNPEETEFALRAKLPKPYWIKINTLLVAFGQTICRPIGPKCHECKIFNCPARCV